MWNGRLTLTVVVSVLVLVGLCSLMGMAYAPYYNDRRSARLTENALEVLAITAEATRSAGATRLAHLPTETAIAGATQTEIARPTITPTPTNTPTPTPTPTVTPPPDIVGCPARVAETGARLYPVPGGGQVRDAIPQPRDSQVTIIGRLEDNGWVWVETAEGAVGWMETPMLERASTGCQANIYDLSFLLDMAAEDRVVVADDTLISNENAWHNAAGEPLSPLLNSSGEAQLVLNTNSSDRLIPGNARLREVPVFDLATSFSRVNFVTGSYVGVRFRASDLTYYEVRVLRNCQVEVYAVNERVFTRPVDPGENTCVDSQEDFLRVSFTADNQLTVQFNDSDPFEVHLEDSAGLYNGGGLELVVGRARATFSYIVITAPRAEPGAPR